MDVVSCELFEVNLDKEPIIEYDALSYTWDLDPEWNTLKFEFVNDTKKEERPILCNGKTKHVTMNLYHALTEFRRRKWTRPMWADQIAINQLDEEEKIAQLAIMVDVFRLADCVVIWLGKTSMLRNSALKFMEGLPDETLRPTQTVAILPPDHDDRDLKRPILNKVSRSFDAITSLSKSAGDQYNWLGAILVIGRQWFARAWTLQELLLAKDFKMFMGDQQVSPSAIAKASMQVLDFYATDPFSTQSGLNVSFLSLRRYMLGRATLFSEREEFQNGKRYSAEEYLGMIRVRRSTKMKDKVFAGAALLKPGASFSVTYHSTTLEIYIAFAAERLWPETGISSLSLVGGTAPDTEGLPSWVPDLYSPLRPEPLRHCGCPTFKTPISADKNTFRIDNRTLQVQMATWDIVKETGESTWSWTKYDEEAYNTDAYLKMRASNSPAKERFGLMFSLLNKLGFEYTPTSERTIDVFWQTLIGGINKNSGEDDAVWRLRFQQWFAFTLTELRSSFYERKNQSGNKVFTTHTVKKWYVPLIADWPALEERVATFLDFHDDGLKHAAEDSDTPDLTQTLRKTVQHISKRIWGAETLEQTGMWSGGPSEMSQLMSIAHEADFYKPISVFAEVFEAVYDGRRIFTTDKGYLGTGTEDVKAGDIICLVSGGDVPYILRSVAGKPKRFALVGEAYVHGIMDGAIDGDLMFDTVEIV